MKMKIVCLNAKDLQVNSRKQPSKVLITHCYSKVLSTILDYSDADFMAHSSQLILILVVTTNVFTIFDAVESVVCTKGIHRMKVVMQLSKE
jgi:hypothetical protein